MSDGFPSLPDAVERAGQMGVDPNRSLREFIGKLTGRSGDALDRLIDEGTAFGAAVKGPPPGYVRGNREEADGVLRPSERRALTLVAAGLNSTQIAAELGRPSSTVISQLKTVRQRLRAATITEATVKALITGQLDVALLRRIFDEPPIGGSA